MPGKHLLKFNDYDGEPSTVGISALDLTAVNLDAEASKWAALVTAIEDITLGLKVHEQMANYTQHELPRAKSPDADAQRERKWLVRWQDAANMLEGRLELPCADLTFLDPTARGYANMDHATVAAFVSAFEAIFVSDAGGAVTVQSIQHVGRNT